MKTFEYEKGEINEKEIVYLAASYPIAVGVLSIPRTLGRVTNFFDGWVCLVVTGIFCIFVTGVSAKLASYFPGQTFFKYASTICSKPVALILTIYGTIYFIATTSFQTRFVAIITKQYLLFKTPVEIISLVFLFVIVYAVAGSRIGLIRLNLLFFPITILVALFVLAMNIPNFEFENLSPFFTTSWEGYWKGSKESFFTLSGSEILLFYVAYIKKTEKTSKYAMIGAGIPAIIYLMIYTTAIGVFNSQTAGMLVYPTIELAKEAEVPGSFFGRIESLFFTIWIMAIFNTASLALDIVLISLSSIFHKTKKITFIIFLTPIIYFIAMFPVNSIRVSLMGQFLSYMSFGLGVVVPVFLLIIAKVRGIKGNA